MWRRSPIRAQTWPAPRRRQPSTCKPLGVLRSSRGTRTCNLFGKGVRDLCTGARSWCAKLETLSSGFPAALALSFAPVLGGAQPKHDTRGWVLLLINAIRALIVRLLAAETLHRKALAALPSARSRRDAASEELYRKLTLFQLGLSTRRGPVIPPGRVPCQPEQVVAMAAAVRPHLDSPDLEAAPGVQLLPSLGPSFDQATAALAAASADTEEALEQGRETRAAREATMDELRAQVTAARTLHQALSDLQALGRGEK